MDWKWIIGLAIGVIGIVAPVLWSESREISDRNAAITGELAALSDLQSDLAVTQAVARSDLAMIPPLSSQDDLTEAVGTVVGDIAARIDTYPASVAFARAFDRAAARMDYFVDDLSYCTALDETAAIPLGLMIVEVQWLSAILQEEISLIPHLLRSEPETAVYQDIARGLDHQFLDEDFISIGINACCQAHLSSLDGQHLGNMLLSPGMCEGRI